MLNKTTTKFDDLNKMFKKPTQVLYGFNNPDKQFEHVVLGAKLKMEEYLGVDHSIYALSKSLKKPIKAELDFIINSHEDIIKLFTPLGLRLAETVPDIKCFIYQATMSHPSFQNDLSNNMLKIHPVPTVLVYAHDSTGRRRYSLKEFTIKETKNGQKPYGWKQNSFFNEINKIGWFTDKKIMEKYMLFDIPLNILWDAYNNAKKLNII